jgi:phosphotransferase system HPr-like phosphotransfer protein
MATRMILAHIMQYQAKEIKIVNGVHSKPITQIVQKKIGLESNNSYNII